MVGKNPSPFLRELTSIDHYNHLKITIIHLFLTDHNAEAMAHNSVRERHGIMASHPNPALQRNSRVNWFRKATCRHWSIPKFKKIQTTHHRHDSFKHVMLLRTSCLVNVWWYFASLVQKPVSIINAIAITSRAYH